MFQFQLFGFPVRVEIGFFIVMAFLGMTNDGRAWAIWIAAGFVSVLIHELGHALAGRYYGLVPRIQLYAFGGLTSWSGERRLTNLQSIFISLAGPGAGFLTGALVFIAARNLPNDNYLLNVAILDLLWINIGWGVLNLLPILPLDGGHVARSAVHMARGYPDEITPLKISIGAGVLIFLLAITQMFLWGAILSGWITYQNYMAMRQLQAGPL